MLWKPKTKRTSSYLPWAVTAALSLGVLAGTLLVAALYVRHKGREQIIGQNARILYELWLSLKANEGTDTSASGSESVSDELRSFFETSKLQQLAGVWGTRLFDTNGAFVWLDPTVSETTLPPDEVAVLRRLKPVAKFRENVDLTQVILGIPGTTPAKGPLLEVSIPLHTPGQTRLVGIAQFLIDGSSVAQEFHALDQTLSLQATVTFLAGAVPLLAILWIGFAKLQRANRLLRERTESLLQANQELTMAAKTSAVGAVTAHLIHGLKNPLSGLQNFVATRAASGGEMTETDWELAASSTRRMQNMVGEIVRVLRDEESGIAYELSLEELSGVLERRVRPLAQEAKVEFGIHVSGEATLQNREANVISLVLYNLVQNAIQATPEGKAVELSFSAAAGRVECQVRDEGEGLPPVYRARLFQPCQSSKEGGSGIGLAISKQLANSIGAELDLRATSAQGSVFELVFDPHKHTSEDKSTATSVL